MTDRPFTLPRELCEAVGLKIADAIQPIPSEYRIGFLVGIAVGALVSAGADDEEIRSSIAKTVEASIAEAQSALKCPRCGAPLRLKMDERVFPETVPCACGPTRLEGSDPLDFQLREAREKLEALREFVVLPIFEKELRELDTTLGMIALPRSDPDFAKVVLQALDYRRDWLRKCLEARGPVDG